MVSPVMSVGAPFIGILSVSGLRTAAVRTTTDSSIDTIAGCLFVIIVSAVSVFFGQKFFFFFGQKFVFLFVKFGGISLQFT